MASDPADNEEWELVDVRLPSDRDSQHAARRGLYINFQVSITEQRTISSHSPGDRESLDARTGLQKAAPQDASPLFSTPVEIRLYIYELLMESTELEEHGLRLRRRKPTESPSVLTILLTCPRIHREAEEIFYKNNRLFVQDLNSFLASLRSRRLAAIMKLSVVTLGGGDMLNIASRISSMLNLKSLWFVRAQTIRFIQPKTWSVMTRQIVAEIEKYKRLEEVRVITLEFLNPTPEEVERGQKLREIDERIENAVLKRRS